MTKILIPWMIVLWVGSCTCFQCNGPIQRAGTRSLRPTLDRQHHRQVPYRSPKAKHLATTSGVEEEEASSSPPEVDFDALIKYHGAIAVQMGIFAATFKALDTVVDLVGLGPVPFPAVVLLFYFFSLKSRVFNPLNNQRPKMPTPGDEAPPSKGFNDRNMPSFTPPGIVFPIMWILIIGPLRAYSSALVYETTQQFLNPALLAFVFHLSVGDTWNTINNVERRFGASVVAVLCVTASALSAAVQYHGVDPWAGNLLGLPMIWFSVATSLITATWKINPVGAASEEGNNGGVLDQLYPVRGSSTTSFAWFNNAEDDATGENA